MALTIVDMQKFREVVREENREIKEDLERIEGNINQLQANQDKMFGELRRLGDEYDVLHYRVYEKHEARIKKLEELSGIPLAD